MADTLLMLSLQFHYRHSLSPSNINFSACGGKMFSFAFLLFSQSKFSVKSNFFILRRFRRGPSLRRRRKKHLRLVFIWFGEARNVMEIGNCNGVEGESFRDGFSVAPLQKFAGTFSLPFQADLFIYGNSLALLVLKIRNTRMGLRDVPS